MSYEIIEKLKKEISGYKDEGGLEEVGTVVETGDGIAKISGLRKALSQEILVVETESGAIPASAFNLEENFIGAVVLGVGDAVRVGDKVRQTGKVLSIPVGDGMIGRVVDPLGVVLDGKGKLSGGTKDYLLERNAPSVVARESVNTPVHTGIKAIDAMIPLGRGQRELIIGDRQTGKTAVAIDTILNQKTDAKLGRSQVVCIYVAIGQKSSKVAQLVKRLEEAGAMEYSIVVSAPASSPASLQYLAPFAGCAIGEFFMDKGQDALVIYDDLSKHANAYRQLSLLLRRPPGREAYPGDVFYLHSRLLERAAKLNKDEGGGSLTALPVIETQLGDVSAYIPTNVISITDGQIYLESDLFNQGVRPAINAGLSVSRVGSSAQTKAMKKIAGKLRLELAQFRELQAFVQFASDLDDATKKQIARGQLLVEILKQNDNEPIEFYKQVIAIYAATSGHMDDVELSKVGEFEKGLYDYVAKTHKAKVIDPIVKSGQLDEKTETALKEAVEGYKRTISKG